MTAVAIYKLLTAELLIQLSCLTYTLDRTAVCPPDTSTQLSYTLKSTLFLSMSLSLPNPFSILYSQYHFHSLKLYTNDD